MPTTYKRLGNSSPNANTYTQLYQVPVNTRAIISTISVCNRSSSARTYRIIQVDSGTTITSPNNADFIAFDVTVAANDTTTLTLGMVMDSQQKLGVYASAADVTFAAWGAEIT
jgi:hypothetical protein